MTQPRTVKVELGERIAPVVCRLMSSVRPKHRNSILSDTTNASLIDSTTSLHTGDAISYTRRGQCQRREGMHAGAQ